MSTLKNQIAGVTDKVAGNLKKNVGKAIDNEQMQAEGAARELQGNAELVASRAQENAGGKVDEVAGAVKRRVGEAIDNQQMQVEGAARELKGKARQAINR